jgi:hypothetical protein
MCPHQLPNRYTISRPKTQISSAARISFQIDCSPFYTLFHRLARYFTDTTTTMLYSHRLGKIDSEYPCCQATEADSLSHMPISGMDLSISRPCPYKNLIVQPAVSPAQRSLSPRPSPLLPPSRAAPRPHLHLSNTSAQSVHGPDSPSPPQGVVIRKANGPRHAILGVRLSVVLCLVGRWACGRDRGF